MKYTPPLGSLEADAPYVDGNPTAGIRGSVVPAAPFNQLQKELVHIITQAGLEPSADDLTQVLAALKKLFAAPSAIIPPDGVTIIEKEIGSGKKVLAAASAGTLDTLEAWRKSMIGAPMMLPSPVLPDGYMWPDGTLASFEDWPELEEAYEAGKFEGYVLPASATDEDKKNYPGKWVLAANSAGLYTPRLTGLFARYCGRTGAGKYVTDTGRNVAGIVGGHPGGVKLVSDGGDLYDLHTEGAFYQMYRTGVSYFGGSSGSMLVSFGIDASRSWGVEHSGAEFAPAHYKQPVALYLGKTAKI